MQDVLLFLRAYEIWIYLLLGAAAILVFIKMASAQKEVRSAIYGLEREKAQAKFNGRLAILVILGLIGIAEFSLVTFVQPQLLTQASLATPTISLDEVPTSESLETSMPVNQPSPIVTVTPTSGMASVAEACIPGALEWVNPADATEIKGTVDLRFIVQVQNLGFYKYEYALMGSDQWQTIAAGNELITDENSGGSWVTDTLVPGDYRLRLVAINANNVTIAICAINVRVVAGQE